MVTKEQVIDALRKVQDPELHIDIVTLELLRGVEIKGGEVKVTMTFTTPFCPYGPALADAVQETVLKIKGVTKAEVEVELDPPWQPSDEVKAALGMPL